MHVAGRGGLKDCILRRVKAPQASGKPAPEAGLVVSGSPRQHWSAPSREGNDPRHGKGSGGFPVSCHFV